MLYYIIIVILLIAAIGLFIWLKKQQ